MALDVEGVLRDHEKCGIVNPDVGDSVRLTCGATVRRTGRWGEMHRAHVAAVLRVEIAEWLRSGTAVEAASSLLLRQNHLVARAVLSALADQLDPHRPTLAATEGEV